MSKPRFSLLVLLAYALVGCSSGSDPGSSSAMTAEEKRVTEPTPEQRRVSEEVAKQMKKGTPDSPLAPIGQP
jgi:hypothetical protein